MTLSTPVCGAQQPGGPPDLDVDALDVGADVTMRLTRLALATAGLSAAAVTLALLPGAATAAPEPNGAKRAAAAVKVGAWTRLSDKNVSSLSQPAALPLGSGGTQAVWYQEDGPNSTSVRTRVVLESGKVGSAIVPVVTGWSTLVQDPKIISYGSQRMVVFGGIRSTGAGEKFYGPMAYATSSNGTSWALGSGSLTHTGQAYASYGTAAVDDGGTPLVGVNASSSSYVTFHRGVDPSVPAAAADWLSTTTSGYGLHVGLGRDSKTGQVWAAWYCLACSKAQDGVVAQRIWPKPIGALKRAPQSSTKGQSLNPQQGVAVASRTGGGVYAAYKVGYPTANAIRVWKVGTTQGFTVRTSDADHVSLLPASGGRLWLVWDSNGGSKVKAARTNKKATRLGVVRSLKPPTKKGSYSNVWATGGSGAGGPLHLLVNAQIGATSPQIWYQKVLAGLRLTLSPRRLDHGKVVAKVSDAGNAVSGATVTFRGSSKKTGAKGTATFTVARSVKSGKYAAVAKKSGYAPGRGVVTVT